MPLTSQLFLCDRPDERILCGRATRPESDNSLFSALVREVSGSRPAACNRTLCAHENGELVTADGPNPHEHGTNGRVVAMRGGNEARSEVLDGVQLPTWATHE